MKFSLPFPPSVNQYWRAFKGRVIVSKAGRQYRQDALAAVLSQIGKPTPISDRIAVFIHALPPDNRRRDLDNMLKASLDALKFCGVIDDDSQIDRLSIKRGPLCGGGRLDFFIARGE